jgi:hypothetical protein
MNPLSNNSAVWDSSAVRVVLYFVMGTIPVFLTQTEAVTQWSEWSCLQWMRVFLSALLGGLVPVKAYVDTSAQDNKTVGETKTNI